MFRKLWSLVVLLFSLICSNDLFSYNFAFNHYYAESPLLLSHDQLKEKLSNSTDTEKIINILLKTNDKCGGLHLIVLLMAICNLSFSNLEYFYVNFLDKENIPIPPQQFNTVLQLLLNNVQIIKALEDDCIKHSEDASYPFATLIDQRLLIHPTFKRVLLECITKKTLSIHKDYYLFSRFINYLKEINDNDSLDLLSITIEKNITRADTKVLKILIKNYSSCAIRIIAAHAKLFEQAIQNKEQGIITSFTEAIINKTPDSIKLRWAKKRLARQGLVTFAHNLTQTEAHFWINHHHIFAMFKNPLENNPAIMQMLDKVLAHERQLTSQGKYVFYHAQRWHLYFLEDLYTRLWELKYKTKVPNYLFTRFVKEIADQQLLQEKLTKAAEIRTGLLAQGRDYGHRGDLLFLNYCLFGNSTNSGSCTIGYFLANTNIRSTDNLNAQRVFHRLNLDQLYTTYTQQLQDLEAAFTALNNYGNLLQIALTPEAIKKCLYVAHPGGYKRTVDIRDIGETDDVALIIDTLRTAPHKIKKSDVTEFCLILTRDCALQPGNGIEVYSFNPIAADAWKTYEEKRDALLAQMAPQIC